MSTPTMLAQALERDHATHRRANVPGQPSAYETLTVWRSVTAS